MKRIPILLLCATAIAGQAQQPTCTDSLTATLHTLRQATAQHTDLWGIDLYGPLLFVDPATRTVYANEPDSSGILRLDGTLYTGTLPDTVHTANTAITWGGKTWAMVLLPLPDTPTERTELLAHELFHCAQPRLHFVNAESDNAHLDTEEGRVLLRLELEALKRALRAPTPEERRQHLTHALAFRTHRHRRFPHAAAAEHATERNEGLAEYTGQTVAGLQGARAETHLSARIESLIHMPSFVRSFAYVTLPAYGQLAVNIAPDWHKAITNETPITDYLIRLFGIMSPDSLPASWVTAYDGTAIARQEAAREAEKQAVRNAYRARLIDSTHLELPLRAMQFSFDPLNVVPLDSVGTVYPRLCITDEWGSLTVTDSGALISADWKTITVSAPSALRSNGADGTGWLLTLTEGYTIIRRADHYYVIKEGEE